MEAKDLNRSKFKRSTKTKHSNKGNFRAKCSQGGNGSSSSQVEAMGGFIDVADSSDDRFSNRSTAWSPRVYESEIDMDEVDNEQMRAGDFDLMSQMPTSIGGHFQFSSEKNWNLEEGILDKTEASKYFTLNLKLLNVGLQSIPFYKRMDLPSSMFTKTQLAAMNKSADNAEKNYQAVLKEHEGDGTPGVAISTSRKSSAKSNRKKSPDDADSNKNTIKENDDELNELLELTTDRVANVNIDDLPNNQKPLEIQQEKPEGDMGNKDDIQQWLDNVLEE